MDDATLRQQVKDAVTAKLNGREAFTTADISHPIIHVDESVRHRQVRAIIEEMWVAGDFEEAAFVISPITVYPQPASTGTTVRLFHPDEPLFDPNSYTATHQELRRGQRPGVLLAPQAAAPAPAPVTRGFDMTDEDGDDGSDDNALVITSTVTGAAVTAQCQVQRQRDVINIPRILVGKMGWASGDKIRVSASGNAITVEKDSGGSQEVDAEGRIRLYGPNVTALQRSRGEPVSALLVTPKQGDSYIQVQ